MRFEKDEPKELSSDRKTGGQNRLYRLQEQARVLRELALGRVDRVHFVWKKFVYSALILGVLSLVFFLLNARESRQHLIVALVRGWAWTFSDHGGRSQLFKLPPSPPQSTAPRMLGRVPALKTSEVSPELAGMGDGENAKQVSEDEQIRSRVLAKTPESITAYHLLKQKSAVVHRLTKNEMPDLAFKEWMLIKTKASEFWIDLISSSGTDERDLHCIWSVNVDTNQVFALSQAARDLEARQPH